MAAQVQGGNLFLVAGEWVGPFYDEAEVWGEFPGHEIYVEQEPGSGGKESAESTIRNLAGHRVYADKVTGEKKVRAEPLAAQVQGGNLFLVAGEWVGPFYDEAEVWPSGKHMDQIDAAAGAFNKLATNTAYLPLEKWL